MWDTLSTGADAEVAIIHVGPQGPEPTNWKPFNVGALIIRIGSWGILYYTHSKEPPKLV